MMTAVWKRIVFLLFTGIVVGCGTDDFNQELSQIHKTGPNCAQSSCHAKFTISGTLYALIDGETVLPGEVLWVIPPGGATEWPLTADALGNIWEMGSEHEGQFRFRIGTVTSGDHVMPERRACNTCHVPLGTSDIAIGRMFRSP